MAQHFGQWLSHVWTPHCDYAYQYNTNIYKNSKHYQLKGVMTHNEQQLYNPHYSAHTVKCL
jgi:hypothetical protein